MPDIVLYDRLGSPVILPGADSLTVDTPVKGEISKFTYGELLDNANVNLDFSKGNQLITVPSGYLVREAVINRPDTLIPSNIASGVVIAGITGTHGKKNQIVSRSGTYVATAAGAHTIEHGLGIMPDIIVVTAPSLVVGETFGLIYGLSSELTGETGFPLQVALIHGTNSLITTSSISILDPNENALGSICQGNPRTFCVGGTMYKHIVGDTYYWRALGGLVEHTGYFYIKLALNGSNLTVTGGVPEIQRLNITANGMLVKAVDYVYGDEFVVDLSDVINFYEPLTISVEAVGENLAELYPKQYYDSVSNNIVAGGECGDNVVWFLDQSATLTVSGKGAINNFTRDENTGIITQPWYEVRSNIEKVVLNDGVTRIGEHAFRELPNVNSIVIPSSVVSIGAQSIRQCPNLTNVIIPEGVVQIERSAFYGCTGLTNISIPDSVEVLGDYVIYGCTSVTSIKIPDGIKTVGIWAFGKTGITTITIPDGLTGIPDYFVYNCPNFSSVVIPAGIKSIGKNAFAYTNLTSAVFKVTNGWYRGNSAGSKQYAISSNYLANATTAATYLKTTYTTYYWTRA